MAPPIIITHQWLLDRGACADQAARFAALWPEGAELTRANLARAADAGLALAWLVPQVLTAPALRALSEALAPALRAYDEATAPALLAYNEATAPARLAYTEARATGPINPAFRAYDEAIAPARRAYTEATAPALRAYNEALIPALADALGVA
jgi:hypothetical protein